MDLIHGMIARDRRALARAISLVEGRAPERRALLGWAYRHRRDAQVVGVTGAPGVGKSTLVDALTTGYRREGRTVGIIAVDPSSPFTGGAMLGDRVRMQGHGLDAAVFIRSLATRGRPGGISGATGEVVRLLDAFGFDLILVETVGAGQSEVDIMGLATTVLVVTVPGMGDEVQVMKAGIMEIGDVFCVNKADREGASRTALTIAMWLDHKPPGGWHPPVVQTVATSGQGLCELGGQLDGHYAHLSASGELAVRRERAFLTEVRAVLEHRLVDRILERARAGGDLGELVCRREDPLHAAQYLIDKYLGGAGDSA
ncbi:MAG TPA: methylmalonyl Co-A mutase-associated GTPase MeaB [Clostridiales bacterium UBA8153]|nr:methylmalonyl Co-A mutase-associated GTPase MeaB [Clostridiales bacterium UBA8153]